MVLLSGVCCFIAGVVFGVTFIPGEATRTEQLVIRTVVAVLALATAYVAHTNSVQIFP